MVNQAFHIATRLIFLLIIVIFIKLTSKINSKPLINYALNSKQSQIPNPSPDNPLQPYQTPVTDNPKHDTDWIMSQELINQSLIEYLMEKNCA